MGGCCSSADVSSSGGGVTNTNVKPPAILSVKFCVADADGKMIETVSAFDPSVRVFNLLGTISHKYNGVFTFNWIAENTNGVAPDNYEIVSVSAPATGLELFSKAELPRPWPEGKYRVDILAGNNIIHSAHFNVKSGAGSANKA